MPASPAPSPAAPAAHTATVTAFALDAPSMRQVRLSGRQVAALDGLTVPIALVFPSLFDATQQAELVIQDAVAGILKGRHVSAVLWRDPDLGDVSVWHDGGFLPIATVELTPARVNERAVA